MKPLSLEEIEKAGEIDISHGLSFNDLHTFQRVFYTAREYHRLREALEDCLPVVEEAYWEQHVAGTMPGSGYHHRAQHLAGQKWGWHKPETFQAWLNAVRGALKEPEVPLRIIISDMKARGDL